jgi:hypothetical protein
MNLDGSADSLNGSVSAIIILLIVKTKDSQ